MEKKTQNTQTLNSTQKFLNISKTGEFEQWCDEAMKEVFEGLFFASPHFLKELPSDSNVFEISGVVAFMTGEIEAVLQLSCSKQTLCNLAKYLSEDSTQDEKVVLAIGEAANILFGFLKDKLNTYDLYYEKCLPIVIYGQNHIVLNLSKSASFDQIYKTSYGLFNLKIGFSHKNVISKAS